jgi:fucose permease
MTTAPSQSGKSSYIVYIAFLGFIGLGLSAGLLGLAWPSMREQFKLGLDDVNVLFVVQTITYTIASFYIGRIMARLTSGRTLLAGIILATLCLFGTAAAGSWLIVVVFAALSGFGTGLLDAGLNMYIATYHSVRQMNWLHASFGIGITFGPLIMTYVLKQNLGWQAGYAIVGAILLIPITLFALTLRYWRNEGFQTAENKPVKRASFAQSLRVPALLFGMLTFLAYVGVEIGIGQWAYTLMTESRGIPLEVAGLWVGIYWGTFTIGRILFGVVANRIDVDRTLRLCMLGIIVGTVLLWWNPSTTANNMALLILGLVQAPIFPLLMVGTAKRVGPEHAENGISMQMSAVGIGAAFLPGAIGTIGKNFGLEMMAASFVVMAIFVFAFHELTRINHAESVINTTEPISET